MRTLRIGGAAKEVATVGDGAAENQCPDFADWALGSEGPLLNLVVGQSGTSAGGSPTVPQMSLAASTE